MTEHRSLRPNQSWRAYLPQIISGTQDRIVSKAVIETTLLSAWAPETMPEPTSAAAMAPNHRTGPEMKQCRRAQRRALSRQPVPIQAKAPAQMNASVASDRPRTFVDAPMRVGSTHQNTIPPGLRAQSLDSFVVQSGAVSLSSTAQLAATGIARIAAGTGGRKFGCDLVPLSTHCGHYPFSTAYNHEERMKAA